MRGILAVTSPNAALGMLLALVAGLVNAAASQVFRKQGDEPAASAGFHIVVVWSRVLLCLILLPVFGFKLGSGAFLGASAASGTFQTGNFILVLQGVMMGPIAIAWAIVWLAAPMVGIFWAVYPSNEAWSWQQYMGLGFFVACLPMIGISTYLHNKELGVARPIKRFFFIFMVGGMVFGSLDGYCMKLSNGYANVPQGSPMVYLTIVSVITAVGFTLYHAVRRQRMRFTRTNLVYGSIAGAGLVLQIGIMVTGVKMVQAARFFPAVAASAIVLSTIFSAIWQEERPSRPMIAGILLSIAAIVFFAMG